MANYYPDIFEQRMQEAEMQKMIEDATSTLLPKKKFKGLMFQPGKYLRTDGLSSKKIDETISFYEEKRDKATDPKEKERFDALMERGESLSDLTDNLYERLKANPESMSNWLPQLAKANDQAKRFFKIPSTKIWTLPMELAQYIRVEYGDTNQESRDEFNKLLFDGFELDKNKSYFIKTGVFSSKFEFRNTHCKEPLEIGDYFSVINNFAMIVGAGRSVDLVVREWIEDVEDRPTIYSGMPLHTEFRAFIDLDKDELIGIVPYWNPIVMNHVLATQGKDNPSIRKDYETYHQLVPTLTKDFNDTLPTLQEHLPDVIKNIDLKGKWSLDIMKNGKDLYLIDMARMEKSALTELLPEKKA